MTESDINLISILTDFYHVQNADRTHDIGEDDYSQFMNQLTKGLKQHCLNLASIRIGPTALSRIPKLIRIFDISSINLFENLIGDTGMQSLSQVLLSSNNITRLNIGSNGITDGSVMCLTELIKNSNIFFLQLGRKESTLQGNHFSREGMIAIIESIIQRNQVNALGLKGISNSQVKPIGRLTTISSTLSLMLRKCTKLSTLDISSLNFNESDSFALTQGFSQNHNLRMLFFSDNFLNAKVVSGICQISTLRYLDLSKCKIRNSQISPLIAALGKNNPPLTILNLSENLIDSTSARSLFNTLEKNYTLVELNLSSNQIQSNAASTIASFISKTEILDFLDLSKNDLGDEFASILSPALRQNQSLTTLKLNSCKISDEGAISISTSLQQNNFLRHLFMKDNFFHSETGFEIVNILKCNETLTAIDFSSSAVDKFAIDALNSICKRNLMLKKEKKLQPLKKEYIRLKIQKSKIPHETKKMTETTAQLEDLIKEIKILNDKISKQKYKFQRETNENEKTQKEFEEMINEEKKAIADMEKEMMNISSTFSKETKEMNEKILLETQAYEKNKADAETIDAKSKLFQIKSTEEKKVLEFQISTIENMMKDLNSVTQNPQKLLRYHIPLFPDFEQDSLQGVQSSRCQVKSRKRPGRVGSIKSMKVFRTLKNLQTGNHSPKENFSSTKPNPIFHDFTKPNTTSPTNVEPSEVFLSQKSFPKTNHQTSGENSFQEKLTPKISPLRTTFETPPP